MIWEKIVELMQVKTFTNHLFGDMILKHNHISSEYDIIVESNYQFVNKEQLESEGGNI